MAGAPVGLLERVSLFSDLKPRERAEIAAAMKPRTVAAGDTVAVEGEAGVGFFVIESGTARVSVEGENLRTLGPGDSFGEIALITDSKRTASITAETELHCWGLPAWQFRPIVKENAGMAWKLLEVVAKILAER
jgi:CRP/FNR family transcriptional regulator, cyclic AMP receptor protein